jgi:hypothetical protein
MMLMRYAFFWDITQHRMVILYQCFGQGCGVRVRAVESELGSEGILGGVRVRKNVPTLTSI